MKIFFIILLYLSILLVVLTGRAVAETTEQEEFQVKHSFSGFIQGWYTANLSQESSGFSINRLRLLLKGDVTPSASYFVNFSPDFLPYDFGSKEHLRDARVEFKPNKNFSFTMGRTKIPYSTDNLRPFFKYDFANRPLHSTKNSPYIRDTGAIFSYKSVALIPFKIDLGAFKGIEKKNKTENNQYLDLNYVTRAVINPVKETEVSLGYYHGLGLKEFATFFNFGANYQLGNLFLDGEMSLKNSLSNFQGLGYTAYAKYNIPLGLIGIEYLTPAIRYEFFDPNNSKENTTNQRLTFGLTFEFAKKNNISHIMINYEKGINDMDVAAKVPDQVIIQSQVKW